MLPACPEFVRISAFIAWPPVEETIDPLSTRDDNNCVIPSGAKDPYSSPDIRDGVAQKLTSSQITDRAHKTAMTASRPASSDFP
jgi:hypothetical protein